MTTRTRSKRPHVMGVLFCTTHQIPFEDEPNCHCGVLHPPTLRECAEPCPLWTDSAPVASLPEPTKVPCNGCPWRRGSAAGWLGPFTEEEWLALAHSDEAIACHKTIEVENDWTQPGLRQCAGAAIYRGNVAKSPRNPEVAKMPADRESVFASPMQFREHHTRGE